MHLRCVCSSSRFHHNQLIEDSLKCVLYTIIKLSNLVILIIISLCTNAHNNHHELVFVVGGGRGDPAKELRLSFKTAAQPNCSIVYKSTCPQVHLWFVQFHIYNVP